MRRSAGHAGARLVNLGAALLVLALASTPAAAADTVVQARNFEFLAPAISIAVGNTVTWTFSGEPHTVTSGSPGSPDGTFDSGIVLAGGSYGRTFGESGVFPYFCQLHSEQMTGVITVGAAATPTPVPQATPSPTRAPTPPPTPPPTLAPTIAPTAVPSGPPSAIPTRSVGPSATVAPSTPASTGTGSPTDVPVPSAADRSPGDGPPGPVAVVVLILGLAIAGSAAMTLYRRRRPSS